MKSYIFLFLILLTVATTCFSQKNPLFGKWVAEHITDKNGNISVFSAMHMDKNRIYNYKEDGTYAIEDSLGVEISKGSYEINKDSLYFYSDQKLTKSQIVVKDEKVELISNDGIKMTLISFKE